MYREREDLEISDQLLQVADPHPRGCFLPDAGLFAGDAEPAARSPPPTVVPIGRLERPGESLADHQLGLAVTVTRREVDPVDPGGDRGMHGRDALVEGRFAPHHAEAAPAEG